MWFSGEEGQLTTILLIRLVILLGILCSGIPCKILQLDAKRNVYISILFTVIYPIICDSVQRPAKAQK